MGANLSCIGMKLVVSEKITQVQERTCLKNSRLTDGNAYQTAYLRPQNAYTLLTGIFNTRLAFMEVDFPMTVPNVFPIVLKVEGKVFGQKRPLFTDFSVSLPPEIVSGGGRITLRALITCVVEAEVQAFEERQEQRRLVQILSRADIERGLMRGKIDMGGRAPSDTEKQRVDVDTSVATALLAFEDGLYYVFVEDVQQTELDQEIYLQPETHMTFLRLVALAGG